MVASAVRPSITFVTRAIYHSLLSGKQLKQLGWIHEIACPSDHELYVSRVVELTRTKARSRSTSLSGVRMEDRLYEVALTLDRSDRFAYVTDQGSAKMSRSPQSIQQLEL
jgi:hypothetical protein